MKRGSGSALNKA